MSLGYRSAPAPHQPTGPSEQKREAGEAESAHREIQTRCISGPDDQGQGHEPGSIWELEKTRDRILPQWLPTPPQ